MTGLTFETEGHVYRYNGEAVPSVTSVLKDLGFYHYFNNASNAAEKGTQVHNDIFLYNNDLLVDTDIKREGYLDAYKAFVADHNPKIVAAEQRVYNKPWGYAGTLDLIIKLKNVRVVVDIKTGAKAKWHRLQLCGYAACKNLTKAYALYLRPTGRYSFDEMPIDHYEWYSIMRTYQLRKECS